VSDIGRVGKVRLEGRLQTAQRGSDLLNRKQRIMSDELERLQLQADSFRKEWEQQAGVAALWLARASALDGQASILAASPRKSATVEIHWGGAMGVTYPEVVACQFPVAEMVGGSSALFYAVASHRAALSAAVKQAAIQRALLLLSTALAATRTRQRAVENRWIPKLDNELKLIHRKLEDQELEESLRVRWAADAKAKPSTNEGM